MPKRYAYNTSATQVKKRYAMIGSTATQVKKRYAMIGSTATLVYSAEEEYYTDGTMIVPFSIGVNYNGAGSVANTGGYLQVTTIEDTSYMSNNKIDLTDIKKLYFNISYLVQSNSPHYCALLVGNSRTERVYNGSWLKKVTKTSTGLAYIDVSDLSGSFYIGFGVINGTARATKIYGEY